MAGTEIIRTPIGRKADNMDPRIEKLARTLIRFSTKVQPGENILIQARNERDELVRALVRETYAVGGRPFV